MRTQLAAAALCLALAGCSSSPAPAAAPTTESVPVVVSAACDAALKAESDLGFNGSEKQQEDAITKDMTECRTKAEWMAGAERYRSRGEHGVILGNQTAEDAFTAHCSIPATPPPICQK